MTTMTLCPHCRRSYVQPAADDEVAVAVCVACSARLPEALVKALSDPFDYALGLRDGTTVRFEQARIAGDFVHLEGVTEWNGKRLGVQGHFPYTLDRGIDVRLSEIAWVADAPMGS